LGELAGVVQQCTLVLELEQQLQPKHGTSARYMRGKAHMHEGALKAALEDLQEAKRRQELDGTADRWDIHVTYAVAHVMYAATINM
jgi:hypothetical protein